DYYCMIWHNNAYWEF
nr:immunoglobulin light chain junction region [Macaca mulatta]MOW02761.1 immunoglobulin light chain junction region [Macaca mulatta]